MSHYLTNNEKFHIFSKSPVLSSMAVSQAVNKSGHTVSTNDVWADDVPWFTEVADEAGAITRAADARYNDLILWGSDIYVRKGDKTNGASTGTTFAELWEKHTDLTEARAYALGSVTTQTPTNIVTKTVELKNASDKVVLKYHVGKQIDLLTTANNANVASTWAARMFIDGKVVDQFVSPTDKVFAGNPSTGYTTLVYTATAAGNKYGFVAEGESDDDFVNNAFAGIVQFNKSRNDTHKFAASVFEYVGDKLDATVAALSKAVFGGGTPSEPGEEPTSLTEQVLANTQAITKLNGAANVDGSVLHTVETAINALDNTSDQQGSAGISVVQTNGVVAATVTTATVTEGVIDETTADNVVTASDAKAIADKAASDAIGAALADDTDGNVITEKIKSEITAATLPDGQTIAETTEASKLVTVDDVKTYVENNAKVSIASGNGISVTPTGKATEFTVSVDTSVVATHTDVSTAKSDLQGEIDGVRQIANAAKNTADTAVQSVSRATGSSELITVTGDTDVTISLSTEVATKSDIATEIGKLTAEDGSIKTLQTKVTEIETSLATGGTTANAIKAAQEQADKGVADAAGAQTIANQAVTDAAAAQSTANTAKATANTAVQSASGDTYVSAAKEADTTNIKVTTNISAIDAELAKTTSAVGAAIKAASDAAAQALIDAKKYTDDEIDKVEKSISDALDAHAEDIQQVTEAIQSLSTSGFDRIIVSELPTTDIKLNAIYLVPFATAEKDENVYAEYIYVGGSVTEGVVGGGTFEQIGTTKTDLAEYAKSADVDALADEVAANKTAAEKAISDLKDGSDKTIAALATEIAAAQGDVDTLETVVSVLSQTHASDKAALEASIDAVSAKIGDDSVATQIDDAIKALDVAEATTNGITVSQTDGIISVTVDADGVVTSGSDKVVTSGAVYTAVNNAIATASSAVAAVQQLAQAAQTTANQAVTDATAAQTTADSKIATVNVTTDAATHLGAHHVSATTDTDKNVTIAVSCSDEWEYTGDALTGVTSVINGKMSGGKTIDDANLTSAEGMFQDNTTLTTYVGSLGKLTNGKNMFNGCTGLTTFVADITSLTDGTGMFEGCALTEESLMYIVDSLPVVGEQKTITVGVATGVDKAPYVTEAAAKGWTLI